MPVRRPRISRCASNSDRIHRLIVAVAILTAPGIADAQRRTTPELTPLVASRQSNALCAAFADPVTMDPCLSDSARASSVVGTIQSTTRSPSSAWSVVASAALPGTGQAMLRVERFLPYLAFEAYSWTQYSAHIREYRRYRNAYQELSSRVARSAFTIVFPRGDFEYYERMQHFAESGRFEVVVGGVLDPEPDTTTFNGSVWLLARRTFWSDIDVAPDTSTGEWKQAAEFYTRRAYDQPYRWSWTRSPLEFDEFRRLIRRTNDSNRKALQDLGAIIGNHMLSAVDAYVTVRLRRRLAQEGRTGGWQVEGSLPLASVARLKRR